MSAVFEIPTASPAERRGPDAPPLARERVRLLIVDDHPAVRWGLVGLLSDQTDFEVVAVATNAEAALGEAEREGIDVAVVDYQLGGRNGLWLARRLKELPSPPGIVIFSAFANDHLGVCSIVAGADAILNKGSLGDELCNTIRAVRRGRRPLPHVSGPIADLLRRRLDERDQMIYGMLLAGIPAAEIEQTLALSPNELATRRTVMLNALEALPGQQPARTGGESASGPGRWPGR
jgi:DNA-binding NarL/FixJ family response regulator